MRLTISTHAFEALNLEGTLAISKAMGFKGVDIAGFHNRGKCSYEPDEVGENPQKFADDLNRLLDKYELDAVDFFPQFATSFTERSLNDPDPAVREKNFKSMRGIARFCKLASIPGITVLPGADHVGRPLQQNLELAGEGLRKYTDICGEQDVMVRFEPHMSSVAMTPELAIQLVEMAPKALITLDYSHYLVQYIPMDRIHKMIPHTGHVHIRQARPGKLQTRFVEGTVDFLDVARRLEAAGYKYCLSIEYVCSEWYDANQVDTLTETVVTKEALDKHIRV
jgi:sugar phosphate isomerase/epimerase